MGRYFGTDGFRGEANAKLTADHAFRIGRFLGWYYGELKKRKGDATPARIVVGKDTRRSGYMLEYSLVGGIVASGAEAYLLHVATTPCVAFSAKKDAVLTHRIFYMHRYNSGSTLPKRQNYF